MRLSSKESLLAFIPRPDSSRECFKVVPAVRSWFISPISKYTGTKSFETPLQIAHDALTPIAFLPLVSFLA